MLHYDRLKWRGDRRQGFVNARLKLFLKNKEWPT